MKSKEAEELPLIDKANEDAAWRLALLNSLTPEITGLSLRRHNSMVRLLCAMTTEAFSDGYTTKARTKTIGKAVGRDRSTVFRRLADARALGIVSCETREGEIGQQLSSERTIDYRRVQELVNQRRELAQAEREKVHIETRIARAPHATGESQMRYPRRICDTPVANATPNNPDTPSNPFNSKSGRSDVKNFVRGPRGQKAVAEADVRDLASRIFTKMRYRGDQGQSLWLAAAAVHLGVLDEASVSTAAERAGESGKGPGWFRVVLAEKARMTLPELKTTLESFRITPRTPSSPPPPRTAPPQVRVQRVPRAEPQVAAHEAHRSFVDALATLAASDPFYSRRELV
jgi:hypothetical protein